MPSAVHTAAHPRRFADVLVAAVTMASGRRGLLSLLQPSCWSLLLKHSTSGAAYLACLPVSTLPVSQFLLSLFSFSCLPSALDVSLQASLAPFIFLSSLLVSLVSTLLCLSPFTLLVSLSHFLSPFSFSCLPLSSLVSLLQLCLLPLSCLTPKS